ncbi:hypothetical protein Tco_1134098 [Tanacetum coccineum]
MLDPMAEALPNLDEEKSSGGREGSFVAGPSISYTKKQKSTSYLNSKLCHHSSPQSPSLSSTNKLITIALNQDVLALPKSWESSEERSQ